MMHGSQATGPRFTAEGAMKVGLLGTGFGIAHAHIYHTHPQVSEVVVFGRTPAKLHAFAEQFGYPNHHRPGQHLRRPRHRAGRYLPAHPAARRARHPGAGGRQARAL
jgi:hypothetical protein